ncbi:MAG: peptidylprolyl isomerase [Litorilituus sp.]|jgi:peptidyl-prolyl cis-trans isomerase A (cyclophilin A)|nr:peptidylprolyl isomerase [Litorilituus sp.]
MLKKIFCATLLLLALTHSTKATIVEFQTSEGNFQVNLFDQSTPNTVNNFLQYIDEQHYTNSIVHRVSPNFVVQGGGFTFDGNWPLTALETNAAVVNEPIYSNVKGTIAMAKIADNINSATDQWFFNLTNNASNLDVRNGGFTVFGQVIGDGMTVIEHIASLSLCQSIPMKDYTSQDCSNQSTPGVENFVVIEQIIIIDSSDVTDADLTPTKNTLITAPVEPTPDNSEGGALTWLSVFMLIFFSIRKKIISE